MSSWVLFGHHLETFWQALLNILSWIFWIFWALVYTHTSKAYQSLMQDICQQKIRGRLEQSQAQGGGSSWQHLSAESTVRLHRVERSRTAIYIIMIIMIIIMIIIIMIILIIIVMIIMIIGQFWRDWPLLAFACTRMCSKARVGCLRPWWQSQNRNRMSQPSKDDRPTSEWCHAGRSAIKWNQLLADWHAELPQLTASGLPQRPIRL